ncbi:pyridoxal phosphate-dependent transferase [Aspergillus undulatus]|uniref:pyridoxal phosphate-dependent transferase n=1 Tax=Aspergillus undulatus TaxID=1810928 RepID=UPI003CCD00B9
MVTLGSTAGSQHCQQEYYLSQRAVYNFLHCDISGPGEKSMGNTWSPDNATRTLLHEEVADFIKKEVSSTITADTGPRGSLRLRRAVASHFNEDFHARQPIDASNVLIAPGAASAIDRLAWAICNQAEGMLSNMRIVPVSYTDVDGYEDLDGLFWPDVTRRVLEAALVRSREQGIVMLHWYRFISDEIYGHSTFDNPALTNAEPFMSLLSLDLPKSADQTMLHVLYGASKDFCANGFRLGLICTRNKEVVSALSSIEMFSWSPHLLHDIWVSMLENKQWMEAFMSRKRGLMMKNHEFAASFLRGCGIKQYNSSLSVTSTWAEEYKRRELQIADVCMRQSVIIAPGHVYSPKESRWFRPTFTASQELVEGLARLKRVIDEVERGNAQA